MDAGWLFVLHTAYGKTGPFGGGGTEVIGWDNLAGCYRSWLFDSAGNAAQHELTYHDGTWTWRGETTRCTATFSEDGRIQTDDGSNWISSMNVTLTRID